MTSDAVYIVAGATIGLVLGFGPLTLACALQWGWL